MANIKTMHTHTHTQWQNRVDNVFIRLRRVHGRELPRRLFHFDALAPAVVLFPEIHSALAIVENPLRGSESETSTSVRCF